MPPKPASTAQKAPASTAGKAPAKSTTDGAKAAKKLVYMTIVVYLFLISFQNCEEGGTRLWRGQEEA